MINLYEGNYKKLLIIPAILFIGLLFLILASPGIQQGIDLKGGTTIIVRSDRVLDSKEIEPVLKEKYQLSDLKTTSINSPTTGYGLMIQFSENKRISELNARIDSAEQNSSREQLAAILIELNYSKALPEDFTELMVITRNTVLEEKNKFNLEIQKLISEKFSLGADAKFQIREIGPTLGESFWETAISVSLVSLALVIIIIFAFFREFFPSLIILACVVFDISFALGLMAFFRIPLGLSTIPTLLMLIGYSVDTDILLTTRVLKRKEKNASYRAADSMVTGITMTGTTIAAVLSMLVFSYFVQMEVIFGIAVVMLFGLIGDMLGTWLMNGPLLLWYYEWRYGNVHEEGAGK